MQVQYSTVQYSMCGGSWQLGMVGVATLIVLVRKLEYISVYICKVTFLVYLPIHFSLLAAFLICQIGLQNFLPCPYLCCLKSCHHHPPKLPPTAVHVQIEASPIIPTAALLTITRLAPTFFNLGSLDPHAPPLKMATLPSKLLRTSSQIKSLAFVTVDVFTSGAYAGNPLAIILVPSANNLTKSQKQLIAREFNLSESIFLHQPVTEDTSEWEVEIFTTEEELPFAGHPVIGSAFYILTHLSDRNARGFKQGTLITRAGRIAISQTSSMSGAVQASIPHNIHLHSRTLFDIPRLSSGLSPISVVHKAELHAPLVSIVKGMTFLLVQLPSLELLGKLKLGGGKIDFNGVLDYEDGWGESFVAKYYYVVVETPEEHEKQAVHIRTRMMEQQLEDPATGSAACTLSSYLALKAGKSLKFEITQGVEMGRRSDIGVEVDVGPDKKVKGVRLSGSAVVVMEGSLRV